MSKFKAGDRVIRHDVRNQFGLVAGKEYVVESVLGEWLKLVGQFGYRCRDNHPFSDAYFSLATSETATSKSRAAFKVGDRVVRTERLTGLPGSPDFVPGKVYTVSAISPSGGWVNVDHPFNGSRDVTYPFHTDYFRLAKYSEYFTMPAAAEPTTGHLKDSPIQKHSKGEFYPLCVVGYSDAGRTAFTIENLETGEVLSFMPYEFKGGSNIRAWGNAQGAYKFLAEEKQGMAKSHWIKGRPTFIKNSFGLEIVVPPQHKRWAVTLTKVDLNKDTMLVNGVYYQALEQDIG